VGVAAAAKAEPLGQAVLVAVEMAALQTMELLAQPTQVVAVAGQVNFRLFIRAALAAPASSSSNTPSPSNLS
jgi:hypothetical protein